MGIFTEVVETSFSWTLASLFRPFKLKKWLILTFVAFMAGSLSGGGFNFNLPYGNRASNTSSEKAQVVSGPGGAPVSLQHKASAQPSFKQALSLGVKKIKKYLWVVLSGLALVAAISLVMLWLACRFTFIFFENVLTSTVSVKAPFATWRKPGNSLFWFELLVGAVQTCAFCLWAAGGLWFFFRLGAFDTPRQVPVVTLVLAGLLCVFVFVGLACAGGLLLFVMNNFMVPLMYKNRYGFRPAWKDAWALLRRHARAAVVFLFLRIAMVLCVSVGYGIILLTVILVLALPGVGLGLAGAALYRGLPVSWHALAWGCALVIGVPTAVALWYGVWCLYLPCAFFLRTMSMAFIARLEPGFEMFNVPLPHKENPR